MQKNWIGKSVGAEIKFQIINNKQVLTKEKNLNVYTTRPDTIFGASFLIAPDHKLSKILSKSNTNVREFIEKWEKTFSNEEMIDKGPKEEFSQLFVKHPFTKKELPVYVANYVLSSYGSGAIFGVPAHDERDYLFASKYKLPIIKVVEPYDKKNSSIPYTGPGKVINSFFK